MIKLHTRTRIVDQARLTFDKFVLDLEGKHGLAYDELFSLLGSAIANLAKYQISGRRPSKDDRDVNADARVEFDRFLMDLEREHELTYGELFSMLGNAVANLAKYQIRSERHPDDPDKKGDEA